MTLRRRMDQRYNEGFADAMALQPISLVFMEKYERWAYEAGWTEGKKLSDRYIAAGRVPVPDVEKEP